MLTKQRKTLCACAGVIFFLLPPILLTCPSFFHFARRPDLRGFGLRGSGLARFYCSTLKTEKNLKMLKLLCACCSSHDAGDSPYQSDDSLSPVSPYSTKPHLSARSSASLPGQARISLPNSLSQNSVSYVNHLSPEVIRRVPSPDIRLNSTLSPTVIRRSSSNGVAKNKFRLSGSHLMNLFSSSSSPSSRRKIFSRSNSIESDYVHWWMEDTPTPEVRHWQQVMEKDGQWVYFWHLVRPKLKSAV